MTSDQRRLIESDQYPFEFLSQISERESWRKEIYRPVYHLHKWWATRLGSVFRGILLGSLLSPEADFAKEFYSEQNFSGSTVFDPFMGSGTTVGEAHKLGCTALGRDINPVAAEGVRVSLGPMNARRIEEAFRELEQTVGKRIRSLYQSADSHGNPYEVLYYFWVKVVACPKCEATVALLRSRIIGRNAFPGRNPEIRLSCPGCGYIVTGSLREKVATCHHCQKQFDPLQGNCHGAKATCVECDHTFTILDSVRKRQTPPEHRLLGKLVLKANGDKQYLPATKSDHDSYCECTDQLARATAAGRIALPDLQLQAGHNTRQAKNYGYHRWRDFFNDRQLLGLSWLHEAIADIADAEVRDVFLTLFSSTLEFNNLFASYKGEGTGAVRHMFSHHILKPERLPIEANIWGTPKSSGAFSSLYRTRLLRTLEHRRAPVEVPRPQKGRQRTSKDSVIQCSSEFSGQVNTLWPPKLPLPPRSIHLSCGSSDATHLPAKSVDLVITDPPFFDNVHYSELADFFFAWQALHPRGFLSGHLTTRQAREVQDKEADEFAGKLQAVFAECHRVLVDNGLLVFSYHHSRSEGWSSLAKSVCDAGFSFVNAHPVKAEMSVATPKSQAKEPIQFDVILVCRKRAADLRPCVESGNAFEQARMKSRDKADRLRLHGFRLSKNDWRIILLSQFLAELGPRAASSDVLQCLIEQQANLDDEIERKRAEPAVSSTPAVGVMDRQIQRSLFE